VGKSSLLNAITRQEVSIVSEQAGTTTDPVEKPMELLPLGPVLFIDTAGIDDAGDLGAMRVEKTHNAFDRTDLGVVVSDGEWGEFERGIVEELADRGVPVIAVLNKVDLWTPPPSLECELEENEIPAVPTVATEREGIEAFRGALLENAPADFVNDRPILADLLPQGGMAVLVVPIDKEAPKGRLILPQVQTIRDLLDGFRYCMVARESELTDALDRLARPPEIVVTDSQAFKSVAEMTPRELPLTSFSILFSRFKGDLRTQVEGTLAIDDLRPGDHVLVCESCSHHPIEEDIGRVKIPRWLRRYVGGELEFTTFQGHDFPEDLSPYRMVIHCGACMFNRREMLNRIMHCRRAGVPISNYGLVIARSNGIFHRALEPFPEAMDLLPQEVPL
jgi:[FeFe] hydrogenase H-cluster maturation GTPase HydF